MEIACDLLKTWGMSLGEEKENPVVDMNEEKRNKSAMPVIESARAKIGFESCDLGLGGFFRFPIWEGKRRQFSVHLLLCEITSVKIEISVIIIALLNYRRKVPHFF